MKDLSDLEFAQRMIESAVVDNDPTAALAWVKEHDATAFELVVSEVNIKP